MKHQEFITYLEQQFIQYSALNDPIERLQKKSFIEGLMTASRLFGVSYEELEMITNQYQLSEHDNYLDIPTFIRNLNK